MKLPFLNRRVKSQPAKRWRRTSLHDLEYTPALGGHVYARLTVQSDGEWNVDIQADEERSEGYGNLAQAISAAESSWQEHRITLQHVDAALEQANRRV